VQTYPPGGKTSYYLITAAMTISAALSGWTILIQTGDFSDSNVPFEATSAAGLAPMDKNMSPRPNAPTATFAESAINTLMKKNVAAHISMAAEISLVVSDRSLYLDIVRFRWKEYWAQNFGHHFAIVIIAFLNVI
jgi:hypothetical protein